MVINKTNSIQNLEFFNFNLNIEQSFFSSDYLNIFIS